MRKNIYKTTTSVFCRFKVKKKKTLKRYNIGTRDFDCTAVQFTRVSNENLTYPIKPNG